MKKFLSIVLSILMVVTMLPIAIMPASAAYDYDETTKLSFKITNLVREWKGETKELGESGSGFYEQSLTKVADGKYKYTYKAALSAGGGTWWSDPKTVTFDGVDCESEYYKTFDFTESTPVGGYTMTWTYTLEVKRYKGHTYGAWSDNGDGTHTRTCVINSAHKETASHNYAAATCSAPETCKNCGATQGEPVADAHSWNAATCVLPQTCKYCGITQGEVLGHNMVAATFGTPAVCSRCGATDINISVLEAALINTNVNLPSKAVKDDNAGYNDITWSVVDAGSTGATINGNTLKASYSGEAVIRATIESDSKDFTILFKSAENIDVSFGSVIVSKKDASTLTVAYASFEGGSKDYMVGEPIQITGTTSSNTVTVESGVVADIIIDNLNISSDSGNPFYVKSGANVTLTLKNTNSFTTSDTDAAALRVPDGAVLTIDGDGTLTADSTSGSGFGAGIGGDADLIGESGGKILILGGTVTAISVTGAGIGGGAGQYRSGVAGNGGSITVSGGNVTATSSKGAGIGGGSSAYHLCGSGGIINITGGNVTATSSRGAGIGGGGTGGISVENGTTGEGGIITISGGTVTASSTNRYGGAGIGSGGTEYGTGNIGGTVTITGGTVKATTAATNGEAIGKGYKGTSSGTLQDGYGNPVTLYTFTLSGTSNANVTAQQGLGSYGVNDVKTQDADKLYFYLPAESVATSFTAGGTVYDCVVGLTYYPGHSYLEATCSTAKTCTTCGLTEGEALGHNMVDGICTVCGMGEADGIIYISTAEQLMMFADYVNYVNKDADAVLMADIDLAEYTWTPIGVTAMGEGVTNGYTGSFDGNGHVIRNVTFATPTSAMAAGIFGTVQYGGTVRNLGVENLSFDDNTYDHRAGGIAGQLLADSTISDCYVINSTVKASSRVVGGIVGMNNGTVKNCYTCNMTLAGYNRRFGGISGDYSAGKLENCYTDYSALASSQAGTATNCKAGVSADRFASGEIAYLLNGSKSEGDLVWGQLIGTDSYPAFGGETVYYNESNGYYNILHTCDFSGEWKYDADKHWKECTVDGCDKISKEAGHTYTDGKCDCGYTCPHSSYTNGICDKCDYECPHSWGEGVLTRPVYDAVLGSKDGYYTYTCTLCGEEKTETVKSADYSAYEAVSEEINGLLQSDDLTPEAKQAIYSAANECGLLSNDLTESEQNIVDDLVAELEKIVADAEEKIASGEYVKIDGIKEYNKIADALDAELMENYSQEEIAALAEKAGDEINARLGEIIEKAEALTGSVAENKDALAEIESELSALYAEVKNCLDGVHNGFVYEVTEEAKCDMNAIESATCTLCGETDEREVEGSALEHSFTKYEETEAPKCGVAGKEVAYCDNGCQTTDEKEIPALEHIFLDYVSNGDATCTADGTKTASCIHGCGTTDTVAEVGTKLDHADEDGDKLCDDCGEEVYDRCDICGGKAHGDDKIQLVFCMIITIIRFVTSILKSIN
ncbi:MAG: hypothetical protein E7558_08645 [Ruminococcaceae bacterium]|nr:hypothetical protein [Oscillospiraceae bacterium]